MHHPCEGSNAYNHGNNNEWYWNLNLHRGRLSLANTAAIDGTILPSSSAFYTSAVLTDVGICVGMRNVNLNCENQHCFYPRKIPNCFNNLNIVGEQNKQTWDHACNKIALPPFGTANVTATVAPMYVHHSSVLPPPPPSSTPSIVTANGTAVAYNFKMHNENASLFDNRPSFANRDNRYFSSSNLRTSPYPIIAEDPPPSKLTLRDSFHPYVINRSIKCDLNELQMHVDAATMAVSPLLIPSCSEPLKVLSPSSKNESHRRCHVAAPKKKWIRNYMLSKFVFVVFLCTCRATLPACTSV